MKIVYRNSQMIPFAEVPVSVLPSISRFQSIARRNAPQQAVRAELHETQFDIPVNEGGTWVNRDFTDCFDSRYIVDIVTL